MEGDTLAAVAGPGSGKTETIAERIYRDQIDGPPGNQVVVTFTNNAGDELRERLKRKGARPPRHCGTLHSWAFKELLANKSNRPQYGDMKVIGDRAYEELIKEVIKLMGSTSSVAKAREVAMTSAGTAGNAMVLSLAIRRTMIRRKQLHPDLLLALFAAELEIEGRWASPLRIYVDEFQDTAAIDATIYKLLRERHRSTIYVVGDRRQAVYGFRGASPVHFRDLINEADDVAELTINYRSGKAICRLATDLADGMAAFDEDLAMGIIPEQEAEGTIEWEEYNTAEEEALALIEWTRATEGSRAILTRYNQGVSLIAGVLRANEIKVTASTDQTEVKEDIDKTPGFIDWVLKQPSGLSQAGWKSRMARTGAPFALQDSLAGRLSRARSTEDRMAILQRLEPDPDPDRVYVGTIHSAKGLEWDSVALTGLDNKSFSQARLDDFCLAFVGVTRARMNLKLSYAKSRQAHKREINLTPTRILPWK